MTVPTSVESYLVRQSMRYDVIPHPHTSDSAHTAQAAHVPGDSLAKSVLLEDGGGYLMVVIPSTHRVDLGTVRRYLKREVGLATERDLHGLFGDCEPGAVPPLGQAFGIETIVDESLFDRDDIYFECGDHCGVVHVTGRDFQKLMADAPRGRFSHRIGTGVAELH
ncbi:MAG: YbaK/EbsC family protein [Steroidobacteraceae bacterium]|nr:YbaK/EbsC family protein [Steroidobacteraceae bacterium]